MSEAWIETSLGEVTRRVTTRNGGGLKKVLTVSAEHGLVNQEHYFTKKVASRDTSKYYVVSPGQFVYNKSTSKDAPFGVVARLKDAEPGVVTPLYFVFEADETLVDQAYLELAANSLPFFKSLQGFLREGARSHGLLNVRLDEFFAARLVLPPLATQRRIVAVIDSIDQQIAALDAERNVAQHFHDALAEILIFDAGHPSIATGELAVERGLIGGPFGSSLGRKDYTETGIPVIRGTNMPASSDFLAGDFIFVSADKANQLHRNQATPGDVIFTQRGTLGQVSLVADGFDQYVISQSQMRLRTDRAKALPEYVLRAFRTPTMVRHMKNQNSATANPHINLGILKSVKIPLPSIDRQHEIVALLASTSQQTSSLAREHGRLKETRSATLNVLLSREIEIPETFDELLNERVAV